MSAAVIYIRVSTAEQVENHSLAAQERACIEFCARNDLDVVRIFREEGKSAKTPDRPELQQLIRYCVENAKAQSITALVVYKTDRLARDMGDHVVIRQQLKFLGVGLCATQEAFDDSPQGAFVEGMMALMAQFDNEMRAVRTRDGMREAARAGRWVWQAPVGYRKPFVGVVGPSLELDPERAPLVAATFEEMATGTRSRASVLDHVTRLGLRTRDGKPIAKQTFQRILMNPLYAGRVVVPR